MAYRNYILIIFCVVLCQVSRAQQTSFQEADSAMLAQYQAGNWQAVLQYGQQAIKSGTDYPLLRQRMAYAYFALDNYSAALQQYTKVLADDSHNTTARFYSYLCNLYLNRQPVAYYHLSYLDSATVAQENLSPFGLIQAGVETSVKYPESSLRGTGSYSRIALASRLGWKFQLDQSAVYFSQAIKHYLPEYVASNAVHQFEYYGKLNYSLMANLAVWGGYHYLRTGYEWQNYHSHIGLLGLKFIQPYYTLQADASLGTLTGNHVQQFNAQLYWQPLGNLHFYTLTRGSVLQQSAGSNAVFSQLVGFQTTKRTWLETAATFGSQHNYLDADGLYVYNAIDRVKLKAGATGYYALNRHVVLYLNYTYEQKNDFYHITNYHQHSITGGFTWKF